MISFRFHDLIEYMPMEDKLKLIESLSCDEEVIKHVIDQVLDGCTENGSCGGKYCTAHADPTRGLDFACRQVALRAGETAVSEIKRLQDAVRSKDKELEDYRKLLDEERHLRRSY